MKRLNLECEELMLAGVFAHIAFPFLQNAAGTGVYTGASGYYQQFETTQAYGPGRPANGYASETNVSLLSSL